MEDQLIIVNENDEVVGSAPKLKIHQEGLLHRAFSIFIFNSGADEQLLVAAQRRLKAEMGLNCQLEAFGSLTYRADVGNGLVEYEFDHLLTGHSDLDPALNTEEAIDWRRIPLTTQEQEVRARPDHFTPWLKIIIDAGFLQFPVGS